MPITPYPDGLSSFGIPLMGGGDLSTMTTGNIFFVNSANGRDQKADQSGQGTTPDQPFKTIAYAIGQCTASHGDVIYVLPGHAETIAAAAKINFSVIGVQVIGLGFRGSRPTITFNGTDSIIEVNAASCMLKNVILAPGIDEVVKAISVKAAFFTIDAVDVADVTSKQFIQFCLTNASADDLTIQNCVHHQAVAAAANALWIQLIGADRAKILNNKIFITTTSSSSSSVIESDTTAPLNILISGNTIVQLGGTAVIPINLVASTSGFIARNHVASPKSAIAGSIACASCYAAENYAGHVVNTSGKLEPTVDS